MKSNVDWNYSGKPDFLSGTGSTPAEQGLGYTAALLGAGLYLYLYFTQQLAWAWWQYALAAFLAFDIIGGIVANSLNSCKRLYHTPPRADEPAYAAFFKNRVAFALLHLIHIALAALLFDSGGWFYGAFWFAFLMAGTLIVVNTPLYLQRPMAFLLIALALLVSLYVIAPVRGLEWFAPALMIKLLYAHAVREEPYRPVVD